MIKFWLAPFDKLFSNTHFYVINIFINFYYKDIINVNDGPTFNILTHFTCPRRAINLQMFFFISHIVKTILDKHSSFIINNTYNNKCYWRLILYQCPRMYKREKNLSNLQIFTIDNTFKSLKLSLMHHARWNLPINTIINY